MQLRDLEEKAVRGNVGSARAGTEGSHPPPEIHQDLFQTLLEAALRLLLLAKRFQR
jgi:hypothetical protein